MALPQQPKKHDLSPDATPNTAEWCESYTAGNDLNDPVPVRKGGPAPNGWTIEPFSIYPTGSEGAQKPKRAK